MSANSMMENSSTVTEITQEYCMRLEDVSIGYKSKMILQDVNLSMPKGSIWAIVGPSGAGKTTLFRSLIGLLNPIKGTVSLLGQDVHNNQSKFNNRGKIGYIPQNLGLVNSLDVRTNILLGSLSRSSNLASLLGVFNKADIEYTKELLEALRISDKADKNVRSLSGGERRRVAIARAMLQQPSVLVADEFLSELDVATAKRVMDLVIDQQQITGMSIILIEHNLDMAEKYADKIVLIREGGVKEIIDTDDIQSLARLRGMFEVYDKQ